ncbi:MAG: hypothetical protein ACYS67_09780, partial [Planctomycetota bacterium]
TKEINTLLCHYIKLLSIDRKINNIKRESQILASFSNISSNFSVIYYFEGRWAAEAQAWCRGIPDKCNSNPPDTKNRPRPDLKI